MYTSTRRGPGKGATLLAVLQAILLLSALVLAPATVIAQDTDPAPSQEPVAESTGEASAADPPAQSEPTSEPKQPAPKPTSDAGGSTPKAEPKPTPKPTLSEQGLTIRLYPQKVKLALGGKRIVSAWLCPADDKTPFGGQKKGDGKPGTKDDDCEPVRVKWSVKDDAGARLSNGIGYKTRVTLLDEAPNKLTAKVGDLKRNTRIIVKEKPAKVRPEAAAVLEEIKASAAAEEPVAEVPVAEEPTEAPAEEPVAEEPAAEPVAEVPMAEPTEEPIAEEPVAEPTEAPAEEPVAEVPAAEPTETPAEEPIAEEPVAEPTEAPAEEPVAEQSTQSIAPAAIQPSAAGDPGVGGAANIDQCANGGVGDPRTGCDASGDWINGNLGPSKASYAEGDTIPYRMRLSDLSTGGEIHALAIEWDTTKGGLHAIDYIRSYDATEASANACAGVPGCNGWTTSTAPIPTDPQVGSIQEPGVMTLHGGTITGFSTGANNGYTYSNGPGYAGDKKAGITVYFTADVSNPVMTWGGHISSRVDWGIGQAAGTINGSPYHMRLISLNGKGGNQDRSLSASAVRLQSLITIIKVADPADDTSFGFTATGSGVDPSFTLNDPSNDRITFGPIYEDGTYTFTEDAAPGWDLSFHDPVCSVQDAFGGSQGASGRTITIELREGEIVSCKFKNEQQEGTLVVRKIVVNDNGGSAVATDFAFDVAGPSAQGPVPFAQDDQNPGDPLLGRNRLTVEAGTYNITESVIQPGYSASYQNCSNVAVDPGETEICVITNDDDAASLVLAKTVVNDNGGTAVASDWTLFADGLSVTGSEAGAEVTDVAGTYALSESALAGYTNTSITCDNADGEVTSVTVGLGETVSCTFVNDDLAAGLFLAKDVVNDNGGTAVASDWTLSAGDNDVTGSATPVLATTVAGTYALSESALAGYTNTSITCDNADGEVTSVTVGLGETVTCTFVNDDDAASLVLAKTVVNDNG
ncbi:MAG: hypothetical protein PVH07_02150, partial [Chloroflexota bacterium]